MKNSQSGQSTITCPKLRVKTQNCANSWAGRPPSFCLLLRISIPLTNRKEANAVMIQSSHKTYRTFYTILKFSFPKRPDWLWGPPSPLFNGYWISLPVLQRPGREVVHSPPFSSELTNEWSYTSPPLYAFMAWRGTTLPYQLATSLVGKMCWRNRTGAVN